MGLLLSLFFLVIMALIIIKLGLDRSHFLAPKIVLLYYFLVVFIGTVLGAFFLPLITRFLDGFFHVNILAAFIGGIGSFLLFKRLLDQRKY